MRQIIKPTIFSTFGIILFFLTIFVITASSASTSSQSSRAYKLTEKLGSNFITVASTTPEETPLDPSEIPLDKSVLSTINLRFMDQIYLIEASDISMMLGNASKLEKAKSNFQNFGDDALKTIARQAFDGTDYDKLIYQVNKNGIMRDTVAGFEVYENAYGPDLDDVVRELKRVISTRLELNAGNQDYVTVKRVYHPGTNGTYTVGKYIELDHSAQIIYAWEDGVLYKQWNASGFYDEYAVYGVFDIKNKSKNAWSPIAEKWMPYWMAFYYANDQAAWFGLHELVYWYDEAGNRIEESSDSIGNKKSGGCVRLDRGQMVELYDWTEVGIPFLIYE